METTNATNLTSGEGLKITTYKYLKDPVQRKALKDLLRPMIWNWAIENNQEEYYELKDKGGARPCGSIPTPTI